MFLSEGVIFGKIQMGIKYDRHMMDKPIAER